MLQTNRRTITVVPEIQFTPYFNGVVEVKKISHSRKINFSLTMMPAYFFSRVIGLLPFSIVRNSNGEPQAARVNVFDFLWLIISMSLFLLMAFYIYSDVEIPPGSSDSYVLIVGDSAFIIFGMIYGALIIAMDMFNRNRLVDLLKKFIDFDNEVN